MGHKITTKSGSVYKIDFDTGFWSKNDGGSERVMHVTGATQEELLAAEYWPSFVETKEFRLPEVGERMYITSFDQWWLSTEVATIETI